MAEVKWIKFSTDMFNDEKIKLIEAMPDGDALVIVWCKLLCLAGRLNDGGYIRMGQNILYTDEMLAAVFDKPINTVRLALETFLRFGMLENTSAGLYLTNWEFHQNVAGMELQKEKARLRAARSRERYKAQIEAARTCGARTAHVSSLDSREKKEDSRKKKEDTTPISPSLPKVQYAENVHMTEKEHDALVALVGDEGTAFCIDKLDTYKAANGKKYKSDYAAIRNWAIDRWEQEKKRRGANGRGGADRSPVGYYEPHDASHYDQFTVQ